ncbi:MmgE/PrpD family protein [Spiribacter halobius]|uniref:2-methylcitrate dehydratase n=1 Tax=Sediminicurvatus halobius TaxID=2182432 RepID=A0A2U2N9F8_9GAMM|nr:MmgE/PrpD family protein [Spiribacter halobius]PWG65836.1 2-methylcitrate dehydratase [Spiribacter halobius]UEX77880.1 MmgE/PrpD family protein [Spiribacter halobius]
MSAGSPSEAPTAAAKLATFMHGLRFQDIPPEVVDSARLRILDILGICVAAREESGPQAVRALVSEWGGREQAEIVGWGDRVPAALAALANGTLAHSMDFDDTHHEVRIHPSTVVVPATLAAAQQAGLDGRALITAAVAGFEALVRIGMVAPARFHERGLHATSLCGTLAVAGIAGRALGLDVRQITHALGVAGSQASGLREAYLGEATDTKAFHAGWACHAGLVAAGLAARGFTGASTVLEGRFGYYNAFVSPDPWDIERLTDDLGRHWETPNIVYKLFPCGSLSHGCIDAALRLRAEENLDPDQIAGATCIVPPGMVSTICEPEHQKLDPQSGYQAKFSIQYAVAEALLSGNVTRASYTDEHVRDPRMQALLPNMRYRTDDSMPFPKKYPGGVVVRLQDGRELERRVPNSPGSPDNPATTEHIVRKFHGNVAGLLTRPAADEIVERILGLENEAGIDAVLALCRTD